MNIPDFRAIVFVVPNRPVVKSDLPDFHSIFSFLVKFVRETAFDELHCFFERSIFTRSDEDMKMIRHYDELVKKIGAFFAARQDALN